MKGKKEIRKIIRAILFRNPGFTVVELVDRLNDSERYGVMTQQVATICRNDRWIYRIGDTVRSGGTFHSRVGTWAIQDRDDYVEFVKQEGGKID